MLKKKVMSEEMRQNFRMECFRQAERIYFARPYETVGGVVSTTNERPTFPEDQVKAVIEVANTIYNWVLEK